jgi:hypothetical protein
MDWYPHQRGGRGPMAIMILTHTRAVEAGRRVSPGERNGNGLGAFYRSGMRERPVRRR